MDNIDKHRKELTNMILGRKPRLHYKIKSFLKFSFKLPRLNFILKPYCKYLANKRPQNVYYKWERKYIGGQKENLYYKNTTPSTINVSIDWRTKEVKGVREELVYLGKAYELFRGKKNNFVDI